MTIKTRHHLFKKSLVTILVIGYSSFTLSETEELNTINVESQEVATDKPSTIRKNQKNIQKELIRDTKDLVRYTTDIGISDNGRRLKGFAMRGVEGNRVGITIDGVALPDFEENSLYARYGNFNNSRLSIDSELVKYIDLIKGSNSVNSGSGALGGTVNYHTLNAEDILLANKKLGGFLRSGYASKNRQWINTLGGAFDNGTLDGVLVYSQRRGHEMKSAGGNIKPWGTSKYDTEKDIARRAEIGDGRIHPDPSRHKNYSYLLKLNWKINPQNKIGISVNGQKNSKYTHEHSYSLTSSWREADDYEERINANLFYQWVPINNPIISLLRTDFDYLKTKNGAINYKGNYDNIGNWRDPEYIKGALFNVDNRNMKTEYKRFSIRIDSQPFTAIKGDHLLSFRTYIAKRDFENENNDKILNKDGSIYSTHIYTIQRPTKTKQYGFSLQDNIYWNDIFSSTVGVRYDHEKVDPLSFKDGLPCTPACVRSDKLNNPKETTFINWNGFIGVEALINPDWKVGYHLGSGYRVPTASEMFFTYDNPAGNWKANPNLKSERSLSHSLYTQVKNHIGSLDINLHYTKYKNFLFEQETTDLYFNELCPESQNGIYCNRYQPAPYQQMVNLDRARIYGLEVKSSVNLHEVTPLPEGFKASTAIGYNKGKLSNNDSLLSIQPLKLVFGLDYQDPNDKWGIFSRLTYNRGKKGGDAKITEVDSQCVEKDSWTWLCKRWEDKITHREYRWLNKSYWVFDMFGYYNPTKNITLRAGIYNLFDTKYHTWDVLRGINYRSTINSVDYRHGNQGLERFYAPGRNFSLSAEIRF